MPDETTNLDARALLERAKSALERSYSPYSQFKVGAALLTDSGEVFSGTNVENASYGLTICAERAAISAMVAETGGVKITAVAVAGESGEPIMPCGACRQAISEFAAENCILIFEKSGGGTETCKFSDIFPSPFALPPPG